MYTIPAKAKFFHSLIVINSIFTWTILQNNIKTNSVAIIFKIIYLIYWFTLLHLFLKS